MKRIFISAALAFAFAARVFSPVAVFADTPQSLSMSSTNNCVSPPNPFGTTGIQVSGGSWTGSLKIQASADASNWSPINGVIPSTGAQSTTISANGLYRVSTAGTQGLRVCVNTTGTGTAQVAFSSSQASGLIDVPLQTVVTGAGTSSGNPLYTSTNANICDPQLIAQCTGVNAQGEAFTTDPDVVSTGNSLALGSTSNAVTVATNFNSISRFQVSGTWTGTLIFEGTTDGSNWASLSNTISTANGTISATTTSNGVYRVDSAGYTKVRVRVSSTGTGTATVAYDLSAAVVSPAQLFDGSGNQYVLPRNGSNAMSIDGLGGVSISGEGTAGTPTGGLVSMQSVVPTPSATMLSLTSTSNEYAKDLRGLSYTQASCDVAGLNASGGGTLTAYTAYDNANANLQAANGLYIQGSVNDYVSTLSADGQYVFNLNGAAYFDLKPSITGTGNATITCNFRFNGGTPEQLDANGYRYVNIGGQVGVVSVTTPAPAPTGAHGAVQVEGVASGTSINTSGTDNLTQWGGATLGAATAAGSSASGNVIGIQGVTSGVLVGTNLKQINSTALGSPTAAGTSASGNIQAFQGVNGGVDVDTINQHNPCGNPANYVQVNINISSATTTKILAHSGSTKTYVCAFDMMANGTDTVTVLYGTKTSTECDTSTGYLVGAGSNVGYTFSNNNGEGIVKGDGAFPVWVVPAGDDWCLATSGAVQLSGSAEVVQQ